MGCCLGGDDGEETKNKMAATERTPLRQDSEKSDKGATATIQFESGKSKKKLPFYVQTPIIKNIGIRTASNNR